MANCKRCGKEIEWAVTSHGKNVPLDPKALVFSVMKFEGKMVAVLPTNAPNGERWMVSHFATCPNAAEFSGKNKNEPAPAARDFNEPHTAE